MTKPTIFIYSSPKDNELRDRFVTQLAVLKHQGAFDLWDESQIDVGSNRHQEIKRAMDSAHVAILLISANSLTEEFILHNEIAHLLERKEREGLHIFPVILAPCPYTNIPWLIRMPIRPQNRLPLSGMNEHQCDACMVEIVEEIASLIKQPAKQTLRIGAGHVDFILVAGIEDELKSIRSSIESYGRETKDWRPYHPTVDKRIATFIQNIASSEDYTSDFIEIRRDWLNDLKQAEKKDRIILAIVDAWTICLDQYLNLIQEFDSWNSLNSGVLIPWNNLDSETNINHQKLKGKLRAAFRNRMTVLDAKSFRDEVVSLEDLDVSLRDMLIEIQKRIVETGEVVRKARGDHDISLPNLTGPGGF